MWAGRWIVSKLLAAEGGEGESMEGIDRTNRVELLSRAHQRRAEGGVG